MNVAISWSHCSPLKKLQAQGDSPSSAHIHSHKDALMSISRMLCAAPATLTSRKKQEKGLFCFFPSSRRLETLTLRNAADQKHWSSLESFPFPSCICSFFPHLWCKNISGLHITAHQASGIDKIKQQAYKPLNDCTSRINMSWECHFQKMKLNTWD